MSKELSEIRIMNVYYEPDAFWDSLLVIAKIFFRVIIPF